MQAKKKNAGEKVKLSPSKYCGPQNRCIVKIGKNLKSVECRPQIVFKRKFE